MSQTNNTLDIDSEINSILKKLGMEAPHPGLGFMRGAIASSIKKTFSEIKDVHECYCEIDYSNLESLIHPFPGIDPLVNFEKFKSLHPPQVGKKKFVLWKKRIILKQLTPLGEVINEDSLENVSYAYLEHLLQYAGTDMISTHSKGDIGIPVVAPGTCKESKVPLCFLRGDDVIIESVPIHKEVREVYLLKVFSQS